MRRKFELMRSARVSMLCALLNMPRCVELMELADEMGISGSYPKRSICGEMAKNPDMICTRFFRRSGMEKDVEPQLDP